MKNRVSSRSVTLLLGLFALASITPTPRVHALDTGNAVALGFLAAMGGLVYYGFQQHWRDQDQLEAWIHCMLDLLDDVDDAALIDQLNNRHDDNNFYEWFMAHMEEVAETNDAFSNPSLARYPYAPFLNRLSREYHNFSTEHHGGYTRINKDYIRLSEVFDAIIGRVFNDSAEPVSGSECAYLYHYATRCFDSLRDYHPSTCLRNRLLAWEERRTHNLHWYTKKELDALQERIQHDADVAVAA